MVEPFQGVVFQFDLHAQRWSALPIQHSLESGASLYPVISSIAFDAARNRLVAMAAQSDATPWRATQAPASLWALSLDENYGWRLLSDELPPFELRWGHASEIFSDTSDNEDRYFAINGSERSVWTCDAQTGTDWHQLARSELPDALHDVNQVAWAFAPTHHAIIGISTSVVGSATRIPEAWMLAVKTGGWSPLPSPRGSIVPDLGTEGSLAYDPASDRLILTGGIREDAAGVNGHASIWTYTFSTGSAEGWLPIRSPYPSDLLSRVAWSSTVFQCAENRLLLAGPVNDTSLRNAGLLAVDLDSPFEVSALYTSEEVIDLELDSPSIIYDPKTRKVFRYGGEAGNNGRKAASSTLYQLSLEDDSRWEPVNSIGDAPGGRVGAAFAADSEGGAYLWGGSFDDSQLYHVQFLGGVIGADWERIDATGLAPMGRTGAFMAFDVARKTLMLAGGRLVSDKTVWMFTPADRQWRAAASPDTPDFFVDVDVRRDFNHVPVYLEGNVAAVGDGAVFDGRDLFVFKTDRVRSWVFAFDVLTHQWRTIMDEAFVEGLAPAPGARIAYDTTSKRVVSTGPAPDSPVFAFDTASPKGWIRLCPAGFGPTGLGYRGMASIPDGFIVWGGEFGSPLTWRLDATSRPCAP